MNNVTEFYFEGYVLLQYNVPGPCTKDEVTASVSVDGYGRWTQRFLSGSRKPRGAWITLCRDAGGILECIEWDYA